MKTSLLSGIDEKDQEEVIQSFRSSLRFREQLIKVLSTKIEASRKESITKSSYDKPAWSEYQADNNGYERAVREVISLLNEKSLK